MTSVAEINTTGNDYSLCEQLCNLSFDYGGNIIGVSDSAESSVGVIFQNETYTFDSAECYIIDGENLYQLELYHYNSDDRLLLIVIPFKNVANEDSLNLNSLDLDNIIPKESFHLFYYDWDEVDMDGATQGEPDDGNICIFFSQKNYSLADNTKARDTSSVTHGGKLALRVKDAVVSAIYYNSIGTRMNGSYSSADDIYIDCSPVGESEEDIIYSKKRDTLNDYVPSRKSVSSVKRYQKMILSSENKQMVYGILAGLLSIAFFNRTFTKLVKIN